MADIGEFAKRVAKDYRSSEKLARSSHKLRLLLRTVQNLVRTVYYASLIPDEGRFPTVCLMSYPKSPSMQLHYSFTAPKAPTAEEIARLSQGLSRSSHLCLLSENRKLFLGGIHVTMLDEMRHFGYSSSRAANPLKLVIWGPGHIEASTGGIALVYRAGEIFEEKPLRGSDIVRALAACIEPEVAGKTRGKPESLEDIFVDLIQEIVRLGHGGLLLVNKRPSMRQFTSSKRVRSLLLQKLLIRYWDHVEDLTSRSGGVGNLLAKQSHLTHGSEFLEVSSDTTMLENCVSSIARLAGMDGAIVMDYACKVVAFNAIISKSGKGSRRARVVDEIGRKRSDKEVIGAHGSRHQSALAYVKRIPNSFAFVISQDGGVSAFHNQGNGKVVFDRDLRALG